jgi:hypothetical protein
MNGPVLKGFRHFALGSFGNFPVYRHAAAPGGQRGGNGPSPSAGATSVKCLNRFHFFHRHNYDTLPEICIFPGNI